MVFIRIVGFVWRQLESAFFGAPTSVGALFVFRERTEIMNKKKISLIQAIIQLVAIVALFIPISCTCYVTKFGLVGIRDTYNYMLSLFDVVDWYIADTSIITILLLAISGISLTYFILHFSTKIAFLEKKYCLAIPCLSGVVLLIVAIMTSNYSYSREDKYGYIHSEVLGLEWGFFLICALYLAIIVFELFKHFSKNDSCGAAPASESVL